MYSFLPCHSKYSCTADILFLTGDEDNLECCLGVKTVLGRVSILERSVELALTS